MSKISKEVTVIEHNGKTWQKIYEDGRCTEYGWGEVSSGKSIEVNTKFCKVPTDKTYKNSPDINELKKGNFKTLKITYELK